MKAVKELSDNPKKYLPEEFDNFGNELKDFYFKKVKTKICKSQKHSLNIYLIIKPI